MSNLTITRPALNEYASYYGGYVNIVPDGDIMARLTQQMPATLTLWRGLSPEQGDWRYAPEKWSVKELCGHIIDGERVFAYRALRFARGDQTPLPGFEQDDFIAHANFAARSLNDLADEYEAVRRATIALLGSFDDAAWQRSGVASDNAMSVRAIAYVIAGHELHHLKILRERYLTEAGANPGQ